MTSAQVWTNAAKSYRDFPVLDNALGEHQANVKKAFALILSQERLYQTINQHIEEGYDKESPMLKVFFDRLDTIEDEIKELEDQYGKISTISFRK